MYYTVYKLLASEVNFYKKCYIFQNSCLIKQGKYAVFVAYGNVTAHTPRYLQQTTHRQFSSSQAKNTTVGLTTSDTCWKCSRTLTPTTTSTDNGHPADHFYCPHKDCGVLQPAMDRNHFEQFKLPLDYDIDTNALTKAYRKIQHRLHPDRAAQLSKVM